MIKNVNLLLPGGGVVGRSEKIKKNQKLLMVYVILVNSIQTCSYSKHHGAIMVL